MSNAFDLAAANYDNSFTHSVIGRLQRNQVRTQLQKILSQSAAKRILEVNCGTGEDAMWLSGLGFEVTATDISREMVKIASTKPGDQTVLEADINFLTSAFPNREFDLIFSNFGGLNCLSPEQLEAFFASASKLLSPTGELVLVIMPRNTLWERLYFTLKGDKASAQRRQFPAIATVDGAKIETHYYNPDEIKRVAKDFEVCNVIPIGLFVPPSYLEPFAHKIPWLIKAASALDEILSAFGALGKYSDHFLIRLKS